MRKELDDHGQPSDRRWHHSRLIGRSADELIGLCKGVLADGEVSQSEAEFLLRWMQANAEYVDVWPFSHLYTRLVSALQDGRLDSEEQLDLLKILSDLASPTLGDSGQAAPNEMLCDEPPPIITFQERRFCLTGAFVSGRRADIEALIIDRGGDVLSSVSKKLHYLVIGSHGSRDWLMSTHGTKIQKAAALKGDGHPIAVIAERHFIQAAESGRE